jgi:group I intron endonuclease
MIKTESKNKKVVYIIKNILNNKCYIGSTINYLVRFKKHKYRLNKNKHHSVLLQRAWNKYGEENFVFEIVEEVLKKSKLIEREQHWLDTLKPKYNICEIAAGGDTITNNPRREEIISKIKNTMSDGRLKGKNNPMFGKKRPDWAKRMKENNPAKKSHVRKFLSERMKNPLLNPNSRWTGVNK